MASTADPPPAVDEPFGQAGVRRFLFPALTTCSLALMILSLGMWARSHHVVDTIASERGGTVYWVSSVYGRLLIAWGHYRDQPVPPGEWTYRQDPMRQINDAWKESIWKRIGFEWRAEPLSESWGTSGGWIRMRWPFLAVVFAILPVARVIRERRRVRVLKRLTRGLCPRCGKDIRETPLRCPECGMESRDLFH